MKRQRRVLLMLRSPDKLGTDYLILGVLFVLGMILGHVVGGFVREHQQSDLAEYVVSYSQYSSVRKTVPAGAVVFCYYRSAFALYLMGLAACGAWLVPLYMLGNGFFLAYCIHCFSLSLGRAGVLLAFAAFGIRCLFVLPCCFYLGTRSMTSANQLRRGDLIRDNTVSNQFGFFPLILCGIVLLIGCIVELSLTPRLFSLILDHYY